jgi:hypothetical protein
MNIITEKYSICAKTLSDHVTFKDDGEAVIFTCDNIGYRFEIEFRLHNGKTLWNWVTANHEASLIIGLKTEDDKGHWKVHWHSHHSFISQLDNVDLDKARARYEQQKESNTQKRLSHLPGHFGSW